MSVLELPHHLSASSITTYQQCPLRYRFSRIDKIPEPTTSAMLVGTFVHEILEDFYRLPSEERTLPNARSIASAKWEEEFSDKTATVEKSAEAINDFRWRAWWCIENIFEMEKPEEVNILGVEDEFSGEINDVPLLGYIDRWTEEDGQKIVTDYKTGKVPSQKYDGEKIFQIVLYAEMLERLRGVEIDNTEVLYVRFKTRKRYEPTEDRRKTVLKLVDQTWKGVTEGCTSGVFPTKTGPLCNWCAYKPICPAWS
ncbi:uncharacterized protein METZ01_LOCUS199034 [marine metagenome]|uniref:PD-(D/E)XK endonuclease-like domain-containing protein n=1 Tax=marine metagenome TaxID=408172 RepID=A0A382E6B7_9ZZZZ